MIVEVVSIDAFAEERLDRVAGREQALGFVLGKSLVENVNESTLFADRVDNGKWPGLVDVDRRTHDCP
jgi:hypothetical protein